MTIRDSAQGHSRVIVGKAIVAVSVFLLSTVFIGNSRAASDTAANDTSAPTIGSRIPDLRFKDIRALNRSLSEMGTPKAWVLVFTTTQCPLVRQTLPKLVEIQKMHKDVRFLAVNVGVDDTIREMAAQALDLDIPFAFVKDMDHSCVKALGVQRTPEVVVLDHEMRLQYRGRVDDQLRLGGSRPEPTRHDLEDALQNVLAGLAVRRTETPVD